ncbi:Uncharacterized protein PECH_005481 [Penicillium ucsense]|uniref:Pre-rRNA-processing protein RIX1 n=1 Tax=Penicillium ucsense TaxID=2839758 RepID=A0A8J8WK56_9EURO|nr:Uncharacterized protein PECM_005494 [Penicillium ucsense]KAF7736248.1 Uncharacterized protein PECH_005481 [Penicillium ucsense]
MASTTLRAVTHRLTTTPVEQLPSITAFLATSLSDCSDLLSAPQGQKAGKGDSDHAVQIHKLKTRLASLVQDRTVEGRWTAVVLAKATVEAGQWEILRGYEPIVRGLIGILAKPDPLSTRKMCIITLTRIFHLTYQYPTLVREITTPHLPGFVTAVLNLVSTLVKTASGSVRKPKPNNPFTELALHAILELIPRHPTIFRPFGTQLSSLLAEILSSSAHVFFPESVQEVAVQVFASLYRCAPKDKSGAEWIDRCKSTVLSAHRAADHVFRAVSEQWESVDPSVVHTKQHYSDEAGDSSADALGFQGWSGIHSGVNRLITLLRVLSGIISMPAAATVPIPLGSILDLTSRLASVTVPSSEANQSGVQFNSQISRDEREVLWAELPRIHVACMNLLEDVVCLLENSTASISQNIVDQVTWIFKSENYSRDVRTASYKLLSSVVRIHGPAMAKQTVASTMGIIRSSCNDVLPEYEDQNASGKSQSDSKSKNKGGTGTANADSFLDPELRKKQQVKAGPQFPHLQDAASAFLRDFLASISPQLLSPSIRAEVDRTIILTSDKKAMLASVLNPIPAAKGRGAGSSLMPFLVRGYSDEMAVEALVRPRMPVIMTAPELDAYVEMEEDEEAEEIADRPVVANPQSSTFMTGIAMPTRAPTTEASAASSVQKRTYFEETAAGVQSSTAEQQSAQIKKPRIDAEEDTPASVPVFQPSKIAATMVPKQVPAVSQPSAPQPVSEAVDVATLSVDDSDDELPALNIDPDTDDEDEDDDEDTAMDG